MFSRWVYFFLFCALIISYIFNLIDPIAFLRIFLSFAASFLSGLILLLYFLKNKSEKLRYFLFFLSIFLLLYFFNIYFYLFNIDFPFQFLKDWHFFDNSCFFIDSFNFIFASCAVLYFWFFDFKIFNDKRGRITTLHQWLVFLLLMVFIISGFFMINFRSDLIKDDLKYKLLFQASKIAHQINPDLVDALNFNSDDKNLAEFERIRSYLNSYANILGIESIYTIAKIDDNLFFGPESIDPSSELASDPGTLYERVNPLFYEIFENKEALFLDSYQDEYGSFVSAAAPVISSKSGEVSMLLVIDIPTDYWNEIINSERIRVIYFILFATLFILIGSILLNLRRKDLRKEKKIFYYLEGIFVGLICFYFIFIISFFIRDEEKRLNFHSFYQLADQNVYEPYQELKQIRKYKINMLASFIENSGDNFSFDSFSKFSSSMLDSSSVLFFEWIPKISSSSLPYYYDLANKNGINDFNIFDIDENNVRFSSSSYDYYYPIFYVEPLSGNTEIIGYNIYSDLDRKAPIDYSNEYKLSSISNPIHLIHDDNKRKGARIYFPVIKDGSDKEISGFASAVIYYDGILEKSIESYPDRHFFSSIDFFQYSSENQKIILASWPQLYSDLQEKKFNNNFLSKDFDFKTIHPIFVFGKTYFIVSEPSDDFFAAHKNIFGDYLLFFGFLLSAFISFWLGYLGSRKIELELEVDSKTKDLKKSNNLIKKNLEQQSLLAKISFKLSQFNLNDIDFNNILMDLALQTDSDRCYIFKDSKDSKFTSNINEWCSPGIEPQIDNLQKVPYEIIPSALKYFNEKGYFSSSDIKKAPKDLRDILGPQKVKSILILPIIINNKRFGFIGFDQVLKKRSWILSDINILKIVSSAFASYYERLENFKKIERERSKVSAIVKGIGDGVFVIDKDLKIILFNQKCSELSGFSEEEALFKNYQDVLNFVFEDNGKVNDIFIKKAFASGEAQEMKNHTMLKRKDGSFISVADSAAPLKDKNGEIFACVVVFRDVSKERDIDTMKTEFINLTSHQLKTPLSTINWYSELLLDNDDKNLTENQKEFIAEIRRSNKKMIETVASLLDISKLEQGTFIFDSSIIDLKNISREIEDDFKEKLEQKNINLKFSFSKDLPQIKADSKILKIVLQNLLSNAIKYSPENKNIIIDFSHDDKSKFINIVVKDQGYGIPKNQQENIFKKLFRADNIKSKNIEGTGLGLYLVKMILEKTGSSISFQSEEGKGTSFYISIPF